MTPACKLLLKNKIAFTQHPYEHDANNQNFGMEACEKLGLSPEQVFKTLLVSDGKQFFVVVLPVAYQMNLKKVAQAFACKKLNLAEIKDAERITGYLVGGISPLAQKKQLKTVIDQTAQQFSQIYISGGKRGFDIGLSPQDLAQLLKANFVDVLDI